MPYIKLETNTLVPEEKSRDLLRSLADAVARVASVARADTRAELAHGRRMRMAGDGQIVHVEIRGLDFPKSRAGELSAAICEVVEGDLGVGRESVYIAVISDKNSMWRVDGGSA